MSRGHAILLVAVTAVALSGCQGFLGRRKPQPAPPPPVLAVPKPAPPQPVRAAPPPSAEPKPCLPRTLGPPPRYPDTDAALRGAGGAADRYQLLAAGRILRERRLRELEQAVAGCR